MSSNLYEIIVQCYHFEHLNIQFETLYVMLLTFLPYNECWMKIKCGIKISLFILFVKWGCGWVMAMGTL